MSLLGRKTWALLSGKFSSGPQPSLVENVPVEHPVTASETEQENLRKEVAQITWFHRIDLGHGIITPGPDDSPAKLKGLRLPVNLQGISVLDVGAWDGFFSFEAERRSASRILATD